MRIGGMSGFSHREIAADVGIKSSSVHYHFPTKDNLAAAVIRRYREDAAKLFDSELEREPDPIKAFRRIFQGTLHSEGRMCPCAVLGAAALDLPPEVAGEVKRFFQMCLDKMVAFGLSPTVASEFLSTILGAMVLSAAFGDLSYFDRATGELALQRNAA
jgi:TetR/AcrR family transcriptional repressor of nem operon